MPVMVTLMVTTVVTANYHKLVIIPMHASAMRLLCLCRRRGPMHTFVTQDMFAKRKPPCAPFLLLLLLLLLQLLQLTLTPEHSTIAL